MRGCVWVQGHPSLERWPSGGGGGGAGADGPRLSGALCFPLAVFNVPVPTFALSLSAAILLLGNLNSVDLMSEFKVLEGAGGPEESKF